jgi:hypothetical protein
MRILQISVVTLSICVLRIHQVDGLLSKPYGISNKFLHLGRWAAGSRSRYSPRAAIYMTSDEGDEEDFKSSDDDEDENGGKFVIDDESEDPLPPLPQFLNEEPTSSTAAMDETQRRIEEQQKQIDLLMKAVNSQKSNRAAESNTLMELTEDAMEPLSPLEESSSSGSVAPLRIMLFIDGTWLYYSIHERPEHLCPIIAKLGRGWQEYYSFNWSELPRIIVEALQEQEQKMGWSTGAAVRPMEVSRATVFTSVKKNTNVNSDRIKMFEDMKAANYDVYMMETVGSGEKCIDIQLAVEMLHYATVPNAYDVAILISGDKDFMPALIRTRQKARKVGIVSKRPDCNRALYQTPNLIDYDVIWFEDHLDRLFTPKPGVDIELKTPDLSKFTLIKVIYDYIAKSGLPRVSSRDVGRYLKRMKIGRSDLQSEVKRQFRGLHLFVREAGVFTIQRLEAKQDKTFWITLNSNAKETLLTEARRTQLKPMEKEFFDSYSLDFLEQREKAYEFSLIELGHLKPSAIAKSYHSDAVQVLPQQQEHHNEEQPPPTKQEDYSLFTVVRLKEYCRDRGLAVSGVKSALIERLLEDDQLQQEVSSRDSAAKFERPKSDIPSPPSSPTTEYLVDLVKEYIQASGGIAGSRDIGRYLNANSSFASREHGGIGQTTALAELKSIYGSLARFINAYPELFERTAAVDTDGNYEFQVSVIKK